MVVQSVRQSVVVQSSRQSVVVQSTRQLVVVQSTSQWWSSQLESVVAKSTREPVMVHSTRESVVVKSTTCRTSVVGQPMLIHSSTLSSCPFRIRQFGEHQLSLDCLGTDTPPSATANDVDGDG